MSRSRIYSTEAIVLRRTDYGEADRIVTLLTPKFGKLRVIAKGVRKMTSRKAGHIELFTRTHLSLAQGKTFDIVSQADLIEPYLALREDMTRGSLAHYLCELAEQFGQEDNEDEATFNLLSDGLSQLCHSPDPKLVVRHFELRLLALAGYAPQLFKCAMTGSPLEVDLAQTAVNIVLTTFAAGLGGTLCQAAAGQAREAMLITPSALRLLRVLQTHQQPIHLLQDLQIDVDLHGQLERVLQRYVTYILERAPRSAALARQLQS